MFIIPCQWKKTKLCFNIVCIFIVIFLFIYLYNSTSFFHRMNTIERIDNNPTYDENKFSSHQEMRDHYFSIELPEPGVTELSCLAKSFLYRWHQLHPHTPFYLYVVGRETLRMPKLFPNLHVRELRSSLIISTLLKSWLDAHVQWKYETAMKTIATFDRLNASYNPSDYPIPMYKHLKLIYSIVLLWHYGGTYVSTDICLIKPITILYLANLTRFIRRTASRLSLDFIQISTRYHDLIKNFMVELSNAYQNQDIMTLDAELLLSKVVTYLLLIQNYSIQLLPEKTFYSFHRDAMMSNWFNTENSSKLWTFWQQDEHRLGIHLPIVRVPFHTPIPAQNSLINRLIFVPDDWISSKQISCFHVSKERLHMGQLVYQYSHAYGNNGDYVQAWASLQYYPCIDRFFERDNLHNYAQLGRMMFGQSTFRNNAITPVSILMNGWWAQSNNAFGKKLNWPPPDYFRPIYISMHVNDQFESAIFSNRTTYDHYGPVGARDPTTLKLFIQNNISSWFSGCLTTTLKFHTITNLINNHEKSILVIDVQKDLLEKLVPIDIFREKIRFTTAKYKPITMNQVGEQLEDFNRTKQRLEELVNAKLVFTSRLHVLLPCLALNIPVVFIFRTDNFIKDRRLIGLVDSLVDHVYTEQDSYFWKNKSHRFFIDWQNLQSLNANKRQTLKAMIYDFHQRLKQERKFRIWGQFYRIFT